MLVMSDVYAAGRDTQPWYGRAGRDLRLASGGWRAEKGSFGFHCLKLYVLCLWRAPARWSALLQKTWELLPAASARKALTQSCCYRNAGPCAISELPLTSCPAGAGPSAGTYMVRIAPVANIQPCSLPHEFTVLTIPGTWVCSLPPSRHQYTGKLAKPRWDKLLWLLMTMCGGGFLEKRNQNSWKGSVPRQLHSYAQQSREKWHNSA